MQNFGVTNKEHYGMLWYFLEWSIEPARSAEMITGSFWVKRDDIISQEKRKAGKKGC